MCDLSFWPQNYHITNMSQLAMWIAFLRFRTVLLRGYHSKFSCVKVNNRQESRLDRSCCKVCPGCQTLCKPCTTALTLHATTWHLGPHNIGFETFFDNKGMNNFQVQHLQVLRRTEGGEVHLSAGGRHYYHYYCLRSRPKNIYVVRQFVSLPLFFFEKALYWLHQALLMGFSPKANALKPML